MGSQHSYSSFVLHLCGLFLSAVHLPRPCQVTLGTGAARSALRLWSPGPHHLCHTMCASAAQSMCGLCTKWGCQGAAFQVLPGALGTACTWSVWARSSVWPDTGLGSRQAAGHCSDSTSAALAPPSNFLGHVTHNKQKHKTNGKPQPWNIPEGQDISTLLILYKIFKWLAKNSHKPAQSKNSSPCLLTSTGVSFLPTGTWVSLGSKTCSVLLWENKTPRYLWKRKNALQSHMEKLGYTSVAIVAVPCVGPAMLWPLEAVQLLQVSGVVWPKGWMLQLAAHRGSHSCPWLPSLAGFPHSCSTCPAEGLLWVVHWLNVSALLTSA